MKGKRKWFFGMMGLLLAAIQFVPVARDNPLPAADLEAPDTVASVLRRACYSCHSNETVWPWYSWVAPVSWLVSHDVHEGREKLNFSHLADLPPAEQQNLKREAWKEIADGEMPLWFYTAVHGEARLSAEEKTTLRAWLEAPVSGGE